MKEYKLRTWELAALCALCVSLCVGTWAQGRQRDISSSLVRLHVIAASDETAEQELKLRVRDNVLEYLTPVLDKAESPEEANKRGAYKHKGGGGGLRRGTQCFRHARAGVLPDA